MSSENAFEIAEDFSEYFQFFWVMKNTFLPTSLNLTINICRFVSRSIISWSELEKKYILKKLKHKSKKATKKKNEDENKWEYSFCELVMTELFLFEGNTTSFSFYCLWKVV